MSEQDELFAADGRYLAEAEQILSSRPGGIVRVGPSGTGENIIFNLLSDIVGEDPTREGLLETPIRVVKAWKHWTSGYEIDISALLKTFEDGGENYDEMVVRKGIRIYSHCEHHLAPIIGDCTVAYIPNGRVVGLSKLDRLVDAFARRLQVQERLTNQIADAIQEHLKPLGVGVYINARHMCVESRGVQQQNSDTVTTALRGAIKEQAAARAEFLALARAS
jgi:GTP cyclohydrolase I